ncbi:MAG: ABC transporter substrate-binding protein, partial [Trebonia sp.]
MINDETGAVTFPEARQGSVAAADYVNNYLDGINGHPIVIDSCVGDGTPATAARCANQLVADHPLAILGAADVGAPASIPIYAHANLAYLGGIPFTPVPETAANSVQFWSVSVGDNAAAAVYAGKTLGVKSVAIVYFSNAQGESILPQITPTFKAAGVTKITDIPLSPTSPDPAPQAALVESSGAQLVYVDIPNGCGNVLKSLKSVGFTGKIMGIDPCGAPP